MGSLLALVIAYLTARAAIAGHRVLGFLATAPIAIPGIVLGVGLFLAYTRGPVVLYGTLWILLLAYLTIELPAAYQQLQSAFKSLAPELEEASRVLGASRLRTLRDVTAPLLGPSLVATWCFIFVAVVRELSAAVILFTSQTKVLSVLIFDLKESGDMAAIAVLGLTMLVLTTIVLVAANRIPGFSGVRACGTIEVDSLRVVLGGRNGARRRLALPLADVRARIAIPVVGVRKSPGRPGLSPEAKREVHRCARPCAGTTSRLGSVPRGS